MAAKQVKRDFTADGPSVYFISDWKKDSEPKRSKRKKVAAKNLQEATRLQVERWIDQGALRQNFAKESPRPVGVGKSRETTSANMGTQVEPTELQRSSEEEASTPTTVEEPDLQCSWDRDLRPPMDEPLLGEVAEAMFWSDTWAEVPSLRSFSEPTFLDNRTNRRLSNVNARFRNMSIADEKP
ncbi:hypothetical protein Esi_0029_0133 [Ectocarpus siliculosus]|uniref:Uncharacterized protein n=1 Tax=Ectocarpus siliculosus TaxID=2880 RepID=D7FVE9_ECTSI|nr:hypothetical protein Esi_0029_0133 [Ectocarpus siliculosus]|eukprot:CBJ26321.1 hypothetical protein Esi_0029_0133 [Ectocarpus siliculosus]